MPTVKRAKELYIIAGHNGSGKTTLASELLKKPKMTFLNADNIANEQTANSPGTTRIEAGKIFFKRMEKLIKQSMSFAVESTLAGTYLLKIITSLKKKRYKIRIAYVFLDTPEMAIERIKVRVRSGGHHIPDEDVKRRFSRSMNNFWKMYRPIADEWELYYNGKDEFINIAIGEDKTYTIIDESLFDSFLKGLSK